MECDELIKNIEDLHIDKDSKCNSYKKILDIYYCIDLDKNLQDINNIAKCLETYIIVTFKEYELNIFKSLDYLNSDKSDVVKSGLFTFNRMYKDLKLKTPNDTWFIYISNGDIKNEYKNIFVLLLNKNPSEKCSFYIINKNIKQIPEWTKVNPDYNDYHSKQNDKYLQIVMESMSGSSQEEANKNYNKIIKNIAKETVIEKEQYITNY